MKPIFDHTMIVLEKADDWMTVQEITTEVQLLYPKAELSPVFKKLRNLAHIGYESNLGYRWYEPNELTAKVQECINRGEDW